MSNSHWGVFNVNATERLTPLEKRMVGNRYCKGCGKKLSLYETNVQYHPKCLPSAPKIKRWR